MCLWSHCHLAVVPEVDPGRGGGLVGLGGPPSQALCHAAWQPPAPARGLLKRAKHPWLLGPHDLLVIEDLFRSSPVQPYQLLPGTWTRRWGGGIPTILLPQFSAPGCGQGSRDSRPGQSLGPFRDSQSQVAEGHWFL